MQLKLTKLFVCLMLSLGLLASSGIASAQLYNFRQTPVGTLSVSVSPGTPQGTIYQSLGTPLTVAEPTVRASSYENINVNRLSFILNSSANVQTPFRVGGYNSSGDLVTNNVDIYPSGFGVPQSLYFNNNMVVSANTSRNIDIKVTVPGSYDSNPVTLSYQLLSMVGIGQRSGQNIFSYQVITFPTVTVRQNQNGYGQAPTISSPTPTQISIPLEYEGTYRLKEDAENQTVKEVVITPDNFAIKILGAAVVVDGQIVSSRIVDTNSGSTVTFSGLNSNWNRGRDVSVLVFANGISSFRGTIYTAGISSGRSWSIPISIPINNFILLRR